MNYLKVRKTFIKMKMRIYKMKEIIKRKKIKNFSFFLLKKKKLKIKIKKNLIIKIIKII